MQLHREWLMSDLNKLQMDRRAVANMQTELQALELEYKALKATSYDKMPGASGNNSSQEKMELNLAKREEIDTCLRATKAHVIHMEILLDQLPEEDRDLIEKTVVLHSRTIEQMAEQIGVEPRQVYNKRRAAIDNLLRLRFGQGYRP